MWYNKPYKTQSPNKTFPVTRKQNPETELEMWNISNKKNNQNKPNTEEWNNKKRPSCPSA